MYENNDKKLKKIMCLIVKKFKKIGQKMNPGAFFLNVVSYTGIGKQHLVTYNLAHTGNYSTLYLLCLCQVRLSVLHAVFVSFVTLEGVILWCSLLWCSALLSLPVVFFDLILLFTCEVIRPSWTFLDGIFLK